MSGTIFFPSYTLFSSFLNFFFSSALSSLRYSNLQKGEGETNPSSPRATGASGTAVGLPGVCKGQLNDVPSNSIPLLLLALLANCFDHLRSCLSSLLRPLGLSHCPCPTADDDDHARRLSVHLGSGLTGLIILAEQLNLNRLLFDWSSGHGDGLDYCCMVCLCGLRDRECVRRLPCLHVFHKRCFDGWLGQLKFDCPVCRSKLVTKEIRSTTTSWKSHMKWTRAGF